MQAAITKAAIVLNQLLVMALQALLAVIVMATFAQVVLRYVFSDPTVWSEELARICFVWLTFLGAAVLAGRGEHLAINLFDGRLGASARVWITRLWAVAGIVLFCLLVVASFALLKITLKQVLPASGLSVATLYLAPVSGGLAGIFLCIASVCGGNPEVD